MSSPTTLEVAVRWLPWRSRPVWAGAACALALAVAVISPPRWAAADPQPAADAGADGAIGARTAGALQAMFSRMGYRLDEVRAGVADVPRLFLTSLPSDLDAVPSVEARKRLFIKSLLPLVLDTNESIWAQRERLLELLRRRAEGEPVAWSDRAWLNSLSEDYGVEPGDLGTLRRRVDVIPPALALAQAAAESGWGTSRFALNGNAVFGQRTWVRGGGLVPARRDDDKRHEVKAFPGLSASVGAYMRNLNRHPAYRRFRVKRAEMRASRGYLDSESLIGTLTRYAEDGLDYVESLRAIIRVNRLQELDQARLTAPGTGGGTGFDAGI